MSYQIDPQFPRANAPRLHALATATTFSGLTKVVFNAATVLNGFTESSSVYTCTKAGWYHIACSVYQSTQTTRLIMYKNGSAFYHGPKNFAGIWTVNAPMLLSVGDTIAIYIESGSGTLLATLDFLRRLEIFHLGAN